MDNLDTDEWILSESKIKTENFDTSFQHRGGKVHSWQDNKLLSSVKEGFRRGLIKVVGSPSNDLVTGKNLYIVIFTCNIFYRIVTIPCLISTLNYLHCSFRSTDGNDKENFTSNKHFTRSGSYSLTKISFSDISTSII